MKKIYIAILITMMTALVFTGCTPKPEEKVELLVMAAASLTDVCDELKEAYEEENESTTLNFSFGGSGTLQAQIEEGAPADIFMSAATKQMDALGDKGLLKEGSTINLLENKVVLITPQGNPAGIKSFEEVSDAKIVGLGEPESVPVGQYSKEIFSSIGIWDRISEKSNYGSDVRTVLSWVETGSVDCGVVYATDASTSKNIEVICSAPEGTCSKVIYPAAILKSSENDASAMSFMEFLQSEKATKIFEKYGFTVI